MQTEKPSILIKTLASCFDFINGDERTLGDQSSYHPWFAGRA
jgi:hypothetical protein